MENQQLSKKERYLLRKQQKERERDKQARQNKIKKVIKIVLPVILVAAGIVIAVLSYSPETEQSLAKIEVAPKEYNAGTVSMRNGLVKHTYEIKSVGQEPLEIKRIWTSCMCTTARLRVGDKVSNEFGMHDNPLLWSQEIAPGEIGYLEVSFDPAFHGPSGTGAMIREVYLSTNDPATEKAQVSLLVEVTP